MLKRYYVMLIGCNDSVLNTSIGECKEAFIAAKSNDAALKRAKALAERLSMRVEIVCQYSSAY